MPSLTFAVAPSGVAQLHDLLTCLAKFDETVSIEATAQNLRLSSLNLLKSAHASFTLDSVDFFLKYHFSTASRSANGSPQPWTCQIQNRALLAIFRRRLADSRDRETALERCEFELLAQADQTECRLVFKLICRHGVVKTYKLFYESGEVLHATFDRATSNNYWTVSARTLSDVVEYFGPKTELLDWFFQDGKVTFTSYTEKVQNGREILKQPMHTSVALERKDFDDFNVQQALHIGITVKDFRAIVAHAETTRAHVTSRYSRGNRPMQITYVIGGVLTEFTLMTRGTSSNVAAGSAGGTPARDLSVRPVSQSRQSSRAPSIATTAQPQSTMPPPPLAKSLLRDSSKPPSLSKGNSADSQPAPSASLNPDSLFIPAGDDDQQWDEPNFEEEPDIVSWDNASGYDNMTNSVRRIQDSESESFFSAIEQRPRNRAIVREIAPTQRLSQVKGLFD